LKKYKLLILPDKIVLTDERAAKVREYLYSGGRLLASHRSGLTAAGTAFALPGLGVEPIGHLVFSPHYLDAMSPLTDADRPPQHVMYDRGLNVKANGVDVLARIWKPYFNRTWDHFTSHAHAPAECPTDDPGVVRSEGCIYFAHPVFQSYSQ